MVKDILNQILEANIAKTQGMMNRLTAENSNNRINPQTGTAGFYMRHIAEAQINLGRMFFGLPEASPYEQAQTMRVSEDDGRGFDVEETQHLLDIGYTALREVVAKTSDEEWQKMTTSFWGELPLSGVLGRILNHNAHHIGQVELCLKKGAWYLSPQY